MKIAFLVASLAALALLTSPSHANFPGENGKIAFVRIEHTPTSGTQEVALYTINPDGTGATSLTPPGNSAQEQNPAWSPDGQRILFVRAPNPFDSGTLHTINSDGTGLTNLGICGLWPAWSPDGQKITFNDCRLDEIQVANADGTGAVYLTNTRDHPRESHPAWSPDGQKIAFGEGGGPANIYTINPDGTGRTQIFTAPTNSGRFTGLDWSPDGSKIVFAARVLEPSGSDDTGLYTINRDGSGFTRIKTGPFLADPSWSPDGQRIAFYSCSFDDFCGLDVQETCTIAGECRGDLYTIKPDGTDLTPLSVEAASDTEPSWQPIPINAYPRPKGASPMQVSLVPAYEPCTAPNSTHGAPLAFSSCSPPALASDHLTTGTPDSNQLPVRMSASLGLKVVPGDVQITARLNDVRRKDLTDYLGSLRGQLPVRVTDRFNTPHPGGPGAATTQPFAYGFDIPCAGDTDLTLGAECTLTTTMNALAPGTHADGRRAVWQLGFVRVFDGGADDTGSTTADNTPFATQGIFIP